MNKKSLGEKIKAVRKAKKLTQAQLAELSGTNEKHISKIETGVYFPTYTTLSKIFTACGWMLYTWGLKSIGIILPIYLR